MASRGAYFSFSLLWLFSFSSAVAAQGKIESPHGNITIFDPVRTEGQSHSFAHWDIFASLHDQQQGSFELSFHWGVGLKLASMGIDVVHDQYGKSLKALDKLETFGEFGSWKEGRCPSAETKALALKQFEIDKDHYLGSYLGYRLSAADVNNDQRDDLILSIDYDPCDGRTSSATATYIVLSAPQGYHLVKASDYHPDTVGDHLAKQGFSRDLINTDDTGEND